MNSGQPREYDADQSGKGIGSWPRATCLAFVHIEKAAGTTLTHVLRDHLSLRYMEVRPIYPGPDQYLKPKDLKTLLRINPMARIIGGHSISPATWHESDEPDLKFIALLRDPIRRYVSQYLFWRRRLGSSLTFDEFLNRTDTWNVQTRHISANDNVEDAIKVIENRFMLVGIVEKFDEFLLLLRKHGVLRDEGFSYSQHNQAPVSAEAEQLVDKYALQIRDKNRSDMDLYEAVRDHILPRYLAAFGADIDRDLADLRSRCSSPPGVSTRIQRKLNFLLRNLYIKPLVGLLRVANGLPYKGSYVNY